MNPEWTSGSNEEGETRVITYKLSWRVERDVIGSLPGSTPVDSCKGFTCHFRVPCFATIPPSFLGPLRPLAPVRILSLHYRTPFSSPDLE